MNPADPLPDHVILATVAHLTAQGVRDAARGGVASTHLADALGCAKSTAADRLRELTDAGHLARVDGFPMDAPGQPRPSYLPVGHEDASAAENASDGRVRKDAAADD